MERTPHGAVPIALPFDDEGDLPAPFTLTAAARRALDPADVPDLRVVPDRGPDDLRPAQARALRRSGMRIATIAAAMDVDPALVADWTADLVPGREAPGRRRRTPRAPGALPSARRSRHRGIGDMRAAAAGLAVALARVDADGSAVTLTHDRPGVLGAALDALRSEVRLTPGSLRVAVRTGAGVAADRLRTDLVSRLGVPEGRIVVGRWHGAVDVDAVEIRIRVADRRAVDLIDTWAAGFSATEQGSAAVG